MVVIQVHFVSSYPPTYDYGHIPIQGFIHRFDQVNFWLFMLCILKVFVFIWHLKASTTCYGSIISNERFCATRFGRDFGRIPRMLPWLRKSIRKPSYCFGKSHQLPVSFWYQIRFTIKTKNYCIKLFLNCHFQISFLQTEVFQIKNILKIIELIYHSHFL